MYIYIYSRHFHFLIPRKITKLLLFVYAKVNVLKVQDVDIIDETSFPKYL